MRGHDAMRNGRGISKRGSDWRLTKMILAVFLSFIICYLPATVIKVIDRRANYPGFTFLVFVISIFFREGEMKKEEIKINDCVADAHLISYILIYLSACINPIIYVTMNRQYRRAYNNLFCAQITGHYTTGPSSTTNPGNSFQTEWITARWLVLSWNRKLETCQQVGRKIEAFDRCSCTNGAGVPTRQSEDSCRINFHLLPLLIWCSRSSINSLLYLSLSLSLSFFLSFCLSLSLVWNWIRGEVI